MIIFQNLLDLKNNFNSNLTLILFRISDIFIGREKDESTVQEEFSLQTKCNHVGWYSKKLWSYNHFNDALPVATEMCHLNTSNNGWNELKTIKH